MSPWEQVFLPGGGDCPPTVTISEPVLLGDSPALAAAVTDAVALSDTPSFTPQLPDVVALGDAVNATADVAVPESLVATDLFRAGLLWTGQVRSGTPDSDAWGDGWTDQNSTATNHGNEDPLLFANNTALTERRAYLKIDFRRLTGFVAQAGAVHQFKCQMANGNPTAIIATMTFHAQAGDPFTESTLNWSNQPTPTLFTRTASVPTGGAFSNFTITLTDAELNSLLGQWIYIRWTSPAATLFTMSVRSRENATSRPFFILALERA